MKFSMHMRRTKLDSSVTVMLNFWLKAGGFQNFESLISSFDWNYRGNCACAARLIAGTWTSVMLCIEKLLQFSCATP